MTTFYRTRTLDLGAYLMASGISYVNCESLYGEIFTLVFEDLEKCELLEKEFYSNATINAQKLLASKSYLMKEINKMKGFNK